jgi:hypothetical protein
MERISKNPFSFYDFLGYFIPGALFCYLFAIVFDINATEEFNLEIYKKLGVFDQSVAFIIISYVLGHAVNYFSSLTIEKYSNWSIGYPSRYLFGEKPDCYFKTLKNKDDKKERKSYIISMGWRIGLLIVIFPLWVFDQIIGVICNFRLHYTNTLDNTLSSLIKGKIKQFKAKNHYDFENSDGDFFRPIWHYYYEKFGSHAVKLDNYVALYGFTRSMSFIFCFYCWLIFLSTIFNGPLWSIYLFSLIPVGIIAIILCTFFSYVFYLAFLKFYRRFTLEGFMCLLIDNDLNDDKEKQ